MRDQELLDIKRRFKRVRRELRQLPHDLEQKERAIAANDDITAEAKAINVRQAREKERTRQHQLHSELVKLGEKADRLARNVSTDGGTRDAHARVRQMLVDRIAHERIIEKAEGLHDADTIRALRAEAQYVGNKDGWADSRDTVAACNRALARLGSDDEEALVEIEEVRGPLGKLDEFAAKAAHGQVTPFDRLALGYALGPEETGDA